MKSRLAALVALVLLGAAAVVFVTRPTPQIRSRSTTVAQQPTPVPLASATPVATAAPMVSPAPTTPSAAPVTPAPQATPAPVPRLSPDRPPQIVAVNISTRSVQPGDVVNGTVETSSNVASVEAHFATYEIPMQKIGVGKFSLSYRVPDIPFFFRGKTYAIDIVAHNPRGDTVRASVPITVQ